MLVLTDLLLLLCLRLHGELLFQRLEEDIGHVGNDVGRFAYAAPAVFSFQITPQLFWLDCLAFSCCTTRKALTGTVRTTRVCAHHLLFGTLLRSDILTVGLSPLRDVYDKQLSKLQPLHSLPAGEHLAPCRRVSPSWVNCNTPSEHNSCFTSHRTTAALALNTMATSGKAKCRKLHCQFHTRWFRSAAVHCICAAKGNPAITGARYDQT